MREEVNPLHIDADWPAALEEICARPERVETTFQPIVDLRRGAICGFEGLSRFWGPVSAGPAVWLSAAALYGWTARFEASVLRAFLRARPRLPGNCFLSINISPEAATSAEVAEVLERERDLRGLVFEITEQTPVEDYSELVAALAQWRAAGAMVAIDDAGSGYASLRHVLLVRPQFVKLDRSLISGVHNDPHKVAVVSALGAFANELDAWVVAEGVELPEELDCIVSANVPLAQGFLFGKPDHTMTGLDERIANRIRHRAARRVAGGVGVLVEQAPILGSHDDCDRCPGGADVAVLVDEWNRPVELLASESGGTRRHCVFSCELDDAPADVALRAMARPAPERFMPLACTDERGALVGIVRVERVIEALARRS